MVTTDTKNPYGDNGDVRPQVQAWESAVTDIGGEKKKRRKKRFPLADLND
jgi:hypothetical protein